MENNTKTVVLEQSTNTHVLEGQVINEKDYGNGIMSVETANPGAIVTHGEHGTLTMETRKTFKYIQQELNPVSGAIMNAID